MRRREEKGGKEGNMYKGIFSAIREEKEVLRWSGKEVWMPR